MTTQRFDLRAPGTLGLAGRGVVLAYVGVLVGLPLLALVRKAWLEGGHAFVDALSSPIARDALSLSLGTALLTAVVNGVLGTATAWVLVRYRFPGRSILSGLVDLPLSVPTLVAGLMIILLFGPESPLGRFLEAHDHPIVYARGGIVLALLFVTLPFVVRAVEPVLLELDPAEEEAAKMLGATRTMTFLRVVLPGLLPAALSGSIRSFARSLAEFGSIAVVAGNIPHRTLTAPIYIFGEIESGSPGTAVAMSLVLFGIAGGVIAVARYVERNVGGRHG
ncbi:MAG: ABC transporter permease [Polyangiales bacterium]